MQIQAHFGTQTITICLFFFGLRIYLFVYSYFCQPSSVECPADKIGRLIGPRGSTIKRLCCVGRFKHITNTQNSTLCSTITVVCKIITVGAHLNAHTKYPPNIQCACIHICRHEKKKPPHAAFSSSPEPSSRLAQTEIPGRLRLWAPQMQRKLPGPP